MAETQRKRVSMASSECSLLNDSPLSAEVLRSLAELKAKTVSKAQCVGGGRRATLNSKNDAVDKFAAKLKAMNNASSSSRSRPSRNGLVSPPKIPSMAYFKFYDKARLEPLLRSQFAWFRAHRDAELCAEALSTGEVARYGLSEAEQALATRLLADAFCDWTLRDFWAFSKCCTEHGRADFEALWTALPAKNRLEVVRYSRAFFSNRNGDETVASKIRDVMDGEDTLERYRKYNELLRSFVDSFEFVDSFAHCF